MKYLTIFFCCLFLAASLPSFSNAEVAHTKWDRDKRKFVKVTDLKDRYEYSDEKTNYERIKDGEISPGVGSSETYYMIDVVHILKGLLKEFSKMTANYQTNTKLLEKQISNQEKMIKLLQEGNKQGKE